MIASTAEAPELVATCMHDLARAAAPFADLVAELCDVISDGEFQASGGALRQALASQAAALRPYEDAEGPDNLWMPGIIADARRDAATQNNPWARDVSLIGAVRKGLAALVVSFETAVAVADRANTGERDEHALACRCRKELMAADTDLAAHLARLVRC